MADLCYRDEIPGDAQLLALASLPEPFVFPHLTLGSPLCQPWGAQGGRGWHKVLVGLIRAHPWRVSLALGSRTHTCGLGRSRGAGIPGGARWGEASCAVGALAVQGRVRPQATGGDSLRKRKRRAVSGGGCRSPFCSQRAPPVLPRDCAVLRWQGPAFP